MTRIPTADRSLVREMQAASRALHISHPPRVPVARSPAAVLRYFVEAQSVADALQRGCLHPEFAALKDTGLERGDALEKDIWHLCATWGLDRPEPCGEYASLIDELADARSPAFVCHAYNVMFAHAAGGGRAVGEATRGALGNWKAAYYVWDGDVEVMLDTTRRKIDDLGKTWTSEQQDVCVGETTRAFSRGLDLLLTLESADVPVAAREQRVQIDF